jgi:tetratricopeptide (TPR) repeat protein
VQDAAYGSLLRTRCRELHTRVAAVLEQHFAELVERQPELLAHHLTAAGNNARAVDQWLKAGRHAAARLTYTEAIAHLERGLAILSGLPEGPARDRQELALQLARGLCLFPAKGGVAARPAYVRAHELADEQGSSPQQFEALYGVWQCHLSSSGIVAARPFSDQLLRLSEREQDPGLRLQAHHAGWSTMLFAGEPAKARDHADAGRRLYDLEAHRTHRLLYGGHDPGMCARYTGATAEWLLGYPEKAIASIAEALALGARIAHPFTTTVALTMAAVVHLNNREPEEALTRFEAVEALAAEQRLSLTIELDFIRGAALVGQGAAREGAVRIGQGVAAWRRRRATLYLPFGLALLADALARCGEYAAALATIREGLEAATATGEHVWDAELHRLHGVVLLADNKVDEAQASLEMALRVARGQQARAYELRTATCLARLWGEQGRRTEACNLLAPLYGWFTEGFDTADLKDAKALLDELR